MGTTSPRCPAARSVGPIVAAAAIAIMSAFVTAIAFTFTSAEIDAIRSTLDAGDTPAARRAMHSSLRPQIHHADGAIAMLLQASMDEIGDSAEEQANDRRRSTRLALLLDALCVVVAFVFGSLAVVAVRRERARLCTQIAELEIFADRVAHDIRGPLTPNGGSVHVDSTALGCTFSVELPVWRPVAVSHDAEPIPNG